MPWGFCPTRSSKEWEEEVNIYWHNWNIIVFTRQKVFSNMAMNQDSRKCGWNVNPTSVSESCESIKKCLKMDIVIATMNILFRYRSTIWTACSCSWFLQPIDLQTGCQWPFDYWKMHGRAERKSTPRMRVFPLTVPWPMKFSLFKKLVIAASSQEPGEESGFWERGIALIYQ